MNKRHLSTQRAREKALFRYFNALERGDFETVAAISQQAVTDPLLERMIAEVNEVLAGESPPRHHVNIVQPRTRRGIVQVITLREPSPDGQTPESNHHQEEDNTMFTTFDDTIRKGNYRLQFLTAIAAALILITLGAILLDMASRFAPSQESIVPPALSAPMLAGCRAPNDADAQSESVRLATEASALLEIRALLNTPVEDRPARIEQAGLLALCALQTAYTPEADEALQSALVAMEVVPTFPGHSRVFNSAVFSPDGKYFLVSIDDGAHLLNVETGEEIEVFPSDEPLNAFGNGVFSSNGQYVLTNVAYDKARLWDVGTGTAIRDFIDVTGLFALSPNGEYAAFGVNGDIQLWKVDTGTLEQTLRTDSEMEWIAFSPDSASLLIGGDPARPSAVHLWDVKTGTKIRDFLGLQTESNVAVFSPDGRYVISGSDGGDSRLWDAETGAEIRRFTDFPTNLGGFNNAQAFAFSPDGRYVLIGSANRTARIFEVETGVEVRSFNDNPGYVVSVGFSPDGRTILIGSYSGSDGSVVLWPTTTSDFIAYACQYMTRDFTAEERAQYGISDGAPTCPQFGDNYVLPEGMTPVPTQPIPVWTPLPPLEGAGS